MNAYKVITSKDQYGVFASVIVKADKFKISPNGDLVFFSSDGDVVVENTAFAKGNWIKVSLYY